MVFMCILYSNKDHIEEMKRVNDEKLADLNSKVEDCESTLKSHRRELTVSDNFPSNSISFVDQIINQIHFCLFEILFRFIITPVISVHSN